MRFFILGTGTPIGDPTEINALGTFFSQNANNKNARPILVGSVKTNIGHTESAAGVAGLIKILLMMREGKIVRSLHLKKDKSNLNKRIELDKYNLDIVTENSEWKPNSKGYRIACVNSFGFGGSNCHAIVRNMNDVTQTQPSCASDTKHIISITAIDDKRLKLNLEAFAQDLLSDDSHVSDISMTSLLYRDQWPHRVLIFGNTKDDIIKAIAKAKPLEKLKTPSKKNVVFVFCGVGTTWPGMCKEFMSNDIFRRKIEEIDRHLQQYVQFRMLDVFANSSNYDDPLLNHIAIFCCQVALAEMWIQLGIKPDSIVGQSVGEVAAASISGILPLSEAVKVIVLRSMILAKCKGGSMAVLKGIDVKDIENICLKQGNVNIAVFSSPVGCTISGDSTAVHEVCEFVKNRETQKPGDVKVIQLNVATAYHSAIVDKCSHEIESEIRELQTTGLFEYQTISSVSGKVATTDDFTSGNYWSKNVRQPVLFYQSIQKAAIVDKRNVFIEIGPRQVLKAHIGDIFGSQVLSSCHPSMNPNKGMDCFFETISFLHANEYDLRWEMFVPERRIPVKIPRTQFSPSKQIVHIGADVKKRLAGVQGSSEHLHLFIQENQAKGNDTYQIVFNERTTAFAFDHRMSDVMLVPGATYIEVGFYVGANVFLKKSMNFSISVEFESPVILQNGTETIVDVFVDKRNAHSLEYYCQDKSGIIVARGECFLLNQYSPQNVAVSQILNRCQKNKSRNEIYSALEKLEFKYGPALSFIQNSWCNESECIVELQLPDEIKHELMKTYMHPAILDCMFQCFANFFQESTGHTMPRGSRTITVLNSVDADDTKLFVNVKLTKSSYREKHFYLLLLRPNGEVLCEIIDFYTQTVSSETKMESFYEIGRVNIRTEREEFTDNPNIIFSRTSTEDTWAYRFAKSYKMHVCNIKEESALSSNVTAYVVVFDKDMETSSSAVADNFLYLQSVLKTLNKTNSKVPIHIITQNTQPRASSKTISLAGSEMWGVVRTLRYEQTHLDIRLVDVETGNLDFDTIHTVVKMTSLRNAELIVSGKRIEHIVLFQKLRSFDREIEPDLESKCIVKSSACGALHNLYLLDDNTQPHEPNAQSQQIRLSEFFCFGQNNLQQTSSLSAHRMWPESEKRGSTVLILEGRGCTKSGDEVGFLFPVVARFPYVNVPYDCTWALSEYPSLEGLMMCYVFLQMCVEYVHENETVAIIGNVNVLTNTDKDIIQAIFLEKRCNVQFVQIEEIQSTTHSYGNDTNVILLGEVNASDVALFKAMKQYPKQILGMNGSNSSSVQAMIMASTNGVKMKFLSLTDIYNERALCRMIPRVLQTLKMFSSFRLCSVYRLFETVSNERETHSLTKEHLRHQVTQNGLFRKNGCYIIIGGLTGLGLLLVEHLSAVGAGYIAIFSRRLPNETQKSELKKLETKNKCQIHTYKFIHTSSRYL